MDNIINTIIDHSTEYAKDLLQDTGQCYPFGAFFDKAGIVHPLEFDLESADSVPNNETVINSLKKFCESEISSGKIIAYGITCEADVQLEKDAEPIDTICIDIVVKNEEQPVYYFPYSVSEGELTYGEAFAVRR